MNTATTEFYRRLAEFFNVSQQTAEQWVWGGLVLGFLFASVHLVTMLITSWGDHHASSKSLLFSLMLHLSSGAGVIILAPELIREQVVKDLEPIRIHDVIIAGERQTRIDKAGNTPIWESIPLDQKKEMTRQQREEFQTEPSQAPERELEKPVELTPEIPTKSLPLPDKNESPELAMMKRDTNKPSEMAEIPELENPELPSMQPDPSQGTDKKNPTRKRSQMPRSQVLTEKIRRPNAGGIDRVSPEVVEQKMLQSLDFERGPTPELPNRGIVSDMINRREAPVPVTADNLITGEDVHKGEGASQPNQSNARAMVRSRRTPRALTDVPKLNRTVGTTPGKITGSSPTVMVPTSPSMNEIPLLADLPTPNFDAVKRGVSAKVPATYRLRDLARRKDIARMRGGTDASEEAVEKALAWLASTQEEAGYWDADKHGSGKIGIDEDGIDRLKAGVNGDAGVTALTVLAFLGAGYTPDEGKYAKTVGKAINWLISQQREDGYLGGDATKYAGMYCHGMASYALAEAYGMQNDKTVEDQLTVAVVKAIQFTVAMQNKEDGGWRYLPKWSGDMSMFGWQMMALKSAEIAGIAVPESAKELMVKFLVDRSLGKNKGLAAYHPEFGSEITVSMTAEALFCKQMLGISRESPASLEATQFMLSEDNLPRMSDPNLYYWYYGTLAMYQFGGKEWEQWNGLLRELLVEDQVKKGDLAGSWNPAGPWGGYGGRVYSTALATLSLEVYYRFLPLYRMGDE